MRNRCGWPARAAARSGRPMPPCPSCKQPASKRNGRDRGGYRWPADVILTVLRWYLAYPRSSRQILELLAERGIDVSHRTILNWVQAFGPRSAAAVRQHRRPVGRCWPADEVFLFHKRHKLSLYPAIDEAGAVIDILLREHRDTASAQAFFRQAIERTGVSHVPTRDRLRNSRGQKHAGTGQHFLEGFEAIRHLLRGGA